MGVTSGQLADFVNLRVIPTPKTFLELVRALEVRGETAPWTSYWYVRVLADRARTSALDASHRHLQQGALPDPYNVSCAAEFVQVLNDVREWACRPSLRELEILSGYELKRSTLSDMLNTPKLPRFDRYLVFLTTCGVRDITPWIYAWRRVASLEGEVDAAKAEAEAAA